MIKLVEVYYYFVKIRRRWKSRCFGLINTMLFLTQKKCCFLYYWIVLTNFFFYDWPLMDINLNIFFQSFHMIYFCTLLGTFTCWTQVLKHFLGTINFHFFFKNCAHTCKPTLDFRRICPEFFVKLFRISKYNAHLQTKLVF